MIKPFVRKSSQVVLKTPIFQVREYLCEVPRTGKEAPYVVIESKDFVNIVALTPEGQVVLVKQWRHGTGRVELEIPAGLVEPGESPEATAARELREETGYVAERVRLIGQVAPNAAYQQNTCYTVLAEGCRKLAETEFDEGEDLELVLADLEQVSKWLFDGTMQNALVFTGLFFWLNQVDGLKWPTLAAQATSKPTS